MTKKATLSIFFLGCLCLGVISCGGSGSTESSDINPGEQLEFVMDKGHGTIQVLTTTPTTGIVYYLRASILNGGEAASDGAISFYYHPSTKEFKVAFTSAKNWHIDPGPIIRNIQLKCSFSATLLDPSWENGQTSAGSMEYQFSRNPIGNWDPMEHPDYAGLTIDETAGTGTYKKSSTAE